MRHLRQQHLTAAISLFRNVQIPTLSSATIKSGAMKPGTLVRYAGMVQDMFQPEWYLPVHMDTTFGTLCIAPNLLLSAGGSLLLHRTSMVRDCIPTRTCVRLSAGTKRAAAAAYRESFTGGDYSSFVGQMQQR